MFKFYSSDDDELIEQTNIGIMCKIHFENFISVLLIKIVKIYEISVFHREIWIKYLYTNL